MLEQLEGETPNGGVRAEVHYLNDEEQPTDKESATRVRIYEYDAEGKVLRTTYAAITHGIPA